MKHDKISIRYNMFFYLTAFVAVLLILLWLFQIVFLDDFYKQIKIHSIKSMAETIENNVDAENFQEFLTSLSQEEDACIKILDDSGKTKYSVESRPDCIIHKVPPSELFRLYNRAEQNGGTYLEMFPMDKGKERRDPAAYPFANNFAPPGNIPGNIIFVKIVDIGDGSHAIVMLNSTITPVNATVNTLRIQLIWVTGITLLMALLMGLFISRKVSDPIIKINSSAKELAKGNYDTIFHGRGYLEIAELNSTLNYAAKELSKVEGLRKELIANISHDLRTPLTMITGYGEVMRDLPGENTPENVQIIIDEAKRLTTLVNDILDISQLESGTLKLNLDTFNITESIRNILQRYNKLTEQDGYRLEFKSDKDIWVNADTVKMSQVIYNLINNAITYTGPDRTVTIIQSSSSDSVKVEITDTGEGISEEMLPLIWDRYYKIDKAHKRAAIGTGLGLSIVKTILDMHGARYGVGSKPGKGSTFWFELNFEQKLN
ncbi:HAMP domain-containing sensor histidine kinase [Ruminiclostridium cellulolyticum]|uniref:histidine kinase n=1 Tax=Ruminiclostridium cellulolyticum (strain ATCC 35319 / DSM 5812 / JCM 6584 / H10) TaxID=394503 RepID=B8I554_RUMCH|nr:HAMP domain-containing sensor histidine kinase [Ruminiclostridium cellulolyticum]ACL74634.1 histidine kinase [Ruminiclostridium cellulolyticum H10]